MIKDLKQYRYSSGADAALDEEFSNARRYGDIRLGTGHLFWKPLFFWHVIPLTQAQRIFRRVQDVRGRLCCGGRTFRMEKLVLILPDDRELELYVGDDAGKEAAGLMEALQAAHPRILSGKP